MALAKLSELLSSVKDNSYAIGSFNVSNMEMAMETIKAAEKCKLLLSFRLQKEDLDILH